MCILLCWYYLEQDTVLVVYVIDTPLAIHPGLSEFA